jgi:hypothetical protein
MSRLKYVFAIVGIVSGLMTSVQMASADGNSTPSVVPPQAESFPPTYGEWGARWWQYVLGIPDNPAPDENPLNDHNGERCGVGQWVPVWFLVGTTGGGAERRCNVPADTGLFFPIQTSSARSRKMETRLRPLANFAPTS